MASTKSLGNKSALDKFYTKREVAKKCIELLDINNFDLIIEPSAGDGAFSSQIHKCIAYDIEPEEGNIIKQDFLCLTQEQGNILVIGNPPFGQQNKLALDFINHAAIFARTIAFILPLSFKKVSVHSKINKSFHLINELEIEPNSFLLNGCSYDVNCIFQIWEKKEVLRQDSKLKTTTVYFDFVKKDKADCSIRRVGGNAGKASLDLNFSEQSNYFIKIKDGKTSEEFINFINSLTFPSANWAVGPKSLSKGELIQVYEENI